MEKTKRSSSIISFLPNRASFSHHPHSPGREPNHHFQRRGFSGPIVSIIPKEAQRKQRNAGGGFVTPQEPSSPKVTCMGQIKLRKMAARYSGGCNHKKPPIDNKRAEKKSTGFLIRKVFRRKGKAAMSGEVGGKQPLGAQPPLLGQMRRFASGRDSLGGFDWRTVERQGSAEEDEESEEDEEVLVPHSAPIVVGSGCGAAELELEPRKEVNLWKRRTLAPPIPLQLK